MSRTPAFPAALLSALALVGGLACAGAEGRSAPPAEAAEGAAAGGEKGARTMRVVRNEKAIEVEAGEGIDLVVTRPVSVPFEVRYEWPAAPSIEGESVRFVRLRIESPPPDVDGGATTHHYELEAAKPGTARVTLAARPASPAAAGQTVALEVTVRSPRAEVPLATLVRDLVATVAGSPASPLEIARRLGEVESDSEGGVYVRPADSRLKRAIVVKRRETGGLNDVQLQLATPGALRAAELEALWGEPARPPQLAIGETKLVFRPPVPAGAPYRATVSLTVDGDESGPVTWVDVIRDAP